MIRLEVKVIPRSKHQGIKEEGGSIKIHLTAPAVDGKANKALIQFLAKRYSVPKSQVNIVKGLRSRLKTVQISDG